MCVWVTMIVHVCVPGCVPSPVMPACSDPGDPVSLALVQVACGPILSACTVSHNSTTQCPAMAIFSSQIKLRCTSCTSHFPSLLSCLVLTLFFLFFFFPDRAVSLSWRLFCLLMCFSSLNVHALILFHDIWSGLLSLIYLAFVSSSMWCIHICSHVTCELHAHFTIIFPTCLCERVNVFEILMRILKALTDWGL